jgi:hypothetical protein
MDKLEHISVGNINGGRLAAHIDEQLKLMVADIDDPNKPAKAKRTLTVTITLSPSKSRREAKTEYGLSTKLAAPEKEECYINIGKVDGQPFASNQMIEQLPLPVSFENTSDNN